MPGAPDFRPGGYPNGDCPCAGSSAARGTRAYCCCPHYLTEVSQQGLAAHVEAVYRSVSLGENSQLLAISCYRTPWFQPNSPAHGLSS